jgi:hypothetical protein
VVGGGYRGQRLPGVDRVVKIRMCTRRNSERRYRRERQDDPQTH